MHRSEALNGSPLFIEGIANLVAKHLKVGMGRGIPKNTLGVACVGHTKDSFRVKVVSTYCTYAEIVTLGLSSLFSICFQSGSVCSRQLPLRCPLCVNESCGPAKEFFRSGGLLKDASTEKITAALN